jgi:Na+-transporting NADH:ubiquinone oxidoreductase subunit NqrB
MQLLKIFHESRYYQIIFLSCFLCYGIFGLHWQPEYAKYAILFFATIATQVVGNYIFGLPQNNWLSAIITALGLSLLLKTNDLYIAFFVGVIAISAKFIFRYNGRHFINPANFGLSIAVLSGYAWLSPSQWGFEGTLFFLIGVLGSVVSSKAKRIDVALVFLGTLLLLQFGRSIFYLGWPKDFLLQQFTNGSLLLFTFFMITDPVSTPKNKWHRWIWAAGIASFSFYLSNFYFINGAPIFALFAFGFLTPIIEYLQSIWDKKVPTFGLFFQRHSLN